MSSTEGLGSQSQETEWVTDCRMVGEGNPVLYRYQGDRVQIEDDTGFLDLTPNQDASLVYNIGVDGIMRFLGDHEDCQINIFDSERTGDEGKRSKPRLLVTGWRDATESEVNDFNTSGYF